MAMQVHCLVKLAEGRKAEWIRHLDLLTQQATQRRQDPIIYVETRSSATLTDVARTALQHRGVVLKHH